MARRSDPERGALTVKEAGRRGGESTAAKYGSEYYERIGQKGGERVREAEEETA